MTTRRRIGIIAFPDVQGLDIVGPSDAFASARETQNGAGTPLYEVLLIGLTSGPVVSESGIIFQPQYAIHKSPPLDTIVIPGGKGVRLNPETQTKLAQWVRKEARRTRRIAAVCTGVYGIAPTGLLDGRRVTTHWRFADDFAARFPKLNVQANSLYVKDGPFTPLRVSVPGSIFRSP